MGNIVGGLEIFSRLRSRLLCVWFRPQILCGEGRRVSCTWYSISVLSIYMVGAANREGLACSLMEKRIGI